MMRRKATAAAAVLAASLAGTAVIPAVAKAIPAGVEVTVVQGGLNAPRHLVLTRAGLVVTEAGTVSPVGASNCATGPATACLSGTTPPLNNNKAYAFGLG